MPSISGSGRSLGEAFRNAIEQVSLGHARGSYTAKGWHAQVRQLFGTERGYQALSDAGVNVTRRTLFSWLSEDHPPSKANREGIGRAYSAMQRGGIPQWVKDGTMKITGEVGHGPDVRDRGSAGNAALRVDLSAGAKQRSDREPGRTRWDEVDGGLADEVDDDDLTDLIGELVAADIEDSYSWDFPGGAYTVVITG